MDSFKKLLDLVADVIARAVTPLVSRLEHLEARKPEKGEKGESFTREQACEIIGPIFETFSKQTQDRLREEISLLKPKDGSDGTSITMDEAKQVLDQAFLTWSKDSDARIEQAIAKIPTPSDGKDGIDGKSLTISDVETWLDANFSKWALAAERRVYDTAEKAIAGMPKPMPHLDAIKIFVDGYLQDMQKEIGQIKDSVAHRSYKGIYVPGAKYLKENCVTRDGSIFIALQDTNSVPGTDDSWQLAVKRGRDGKDGK